MWLQLEEVTNPTTDGIKIVQLLRTGNFKYGGYGAFEITSNTLRELKKNFDNNVRRVKLAVDYFHESYEEAAGWIEQIELRNNDSELWINVDWTPTAVEKILAKEIRYLSADMDFNYMDIETGVEYGCVLMGAGLTNRPYIKDMKAILHELAENDKRKLNDKIKDKKMPVTFEEILSAVTSLSDDQKAQLAEKLGTVKASELEAEKALRLSEAGQVKKLSDDLAALNKQLAENAKVAKFTVLLAEGKVVEGQRAAYLAGDMEAFLAGAVKLNLSETGTGADVDSKNADEAIKKLNEIASKAVEKEGITFSEAFKRARKDNPELAKQAE